MKKVSSFLATLLFASCAWFQPKFKSGLEGQKLPNFSLTIQDNQASFHTDSIPPGKSFILFLYRPNCRYCQEEMQDILNNFKAFSGTPIYLVTWYPNEDADQFAGYFHLKKYLNIIRLRDSASALLTYFKAPGVPYLALYGKQKILQMVIPGRTDISMLKNNLPD